MRKKILLMTFNMQALLSVYDKYAAMHPDWQLQYSKSKPLRLFDHIRSCQNKGSAKELLYKAGLSEIAARINSIEEYNMIGKTPSAILSGLNMRLLNALNTPHGVELLKKSDKRDTLYLLQQRYSWIFEKQLNKSLCQFLELLMAEEDDINEIGKKYKKYYKKLSLIWQNYMGVGMCAENYIQKNSRILIKKEAVNTSIKKENMKYFIHEVLMNFCMKQCGRGIVL